MVPTPTKWIRFFLSCLLLIIRRSVTSVLCSRRKRSRPPPLYLPTVRSWSTCMRDARPSTPSSNPWRSTTASGKLVRTSASDRWPDGLAKRADSGAQFGFRSGAGMIVAAPDFLNVALLLVGGRAFAAGHIPVKACRPDQDQSSRCERALDIGQDGDLGFAIAAPVRPKEEQDGASAQGSQRGRLGAEPLGGAQIERRRGFALQAEQVDVLANALGEGGAGELLELGLQVVDGFGPAAARGQHLGVDLDGGAGGRGQPGIVVELLADEEAGGHFSSLGGESVGLIEVFGIPGCTGEPGEGCRQFRGCGVAGLPGARHAFRARHIVLGDQPAYRVDEGDRLRRGEQGEGENNEKTQGQTRRSPSFVPFKPRERGVCPWVSRGTGDGTGGTD